MGKAHGRSQRPKPYPFGSGAHGRTYPWVELPGLLQGTSPAWSSARRTLVQICILGRSVSYLCHWEINSHPWTELQACCLPRHKDLVSAASAAQARFATVPGPRFLMRHHTGQAVQDAPQEPLDIVPIDPKSPHRVLFPNYRIDFCRRGDISHAPACWRSSLHVGLALLPLNCVASCAGR
jgi:hypothetical protein